MYGSPAEAYRLSGDLNPYVAAHQLVGPDTGRRNQPIRGSATLERVGDTQGQRIAAGVDVLESPSRREVMGLVAERMAATMSMPQAQLGLIRRQRGPDALQDYPDGTGRPHGGHIRAKISLGPAVARPADLGHDPIEDSVDVDYLHNPAGPSRDVLDKYVAAASLIARPTGWGSGFTRLHEGSQFETMGQQILSEVFDDHTS
jgi:hypothetical protein